FPRAEDQRLDQGRGDRGGGRLHREGPRGDADRGPRRDDAARGIRAPGLPADGDREERERKAPRALRDGLDRGPRGVRRRNRPEPGQPQGRDDQHGEALPLTMIEATITTRGLIGFEIDVVNATNGRGVMSHLFKEYGPYAGEVLTRLTGTILATEAGVTTAYALDGVQERGNLFVGPGEEVYEGMIVGENPR